ncbi:MAG TPA: M23 family metallopeptidase [Burkholderiales bacterium]
MGDKIARGDAIAQVGSSGRSTGPHVHVEVLKNGRAVNPAGYLRAGR